MSVSIRPFVDQDLEAIAPIASEASGSKVTAAAIRWQLQTLESRCRYGGVVAEIDGNVVGFGRYVQYPGSYHPQKFDLDLAVTSGYRGRGIGGALYQALQEALAPYDPVSLSAGVRENAPASLRFAQSRGFQEVMRAWELTYDLTTPEPPQYAGILARVLAEGYELRSYSQLSDHPDRDRKLYDLVMEVRRDVPMPDAVTDMSFEAWSKGLQSPFFWGDGYWIGLKDGEMVALSALWKGQETGELRTGLTALRRAHRGSGLAKALKLASLRAAREAGYRSVKTWNESNNERMLRINDQLGFVRQPAWIAHRLQLRPEAES